MSCDKGISLLCIVNSPLFDAVAATWTSLDTWNVYVFFVMCVDTSPKTNTKGHW